jgi:Domain of unknown function (DUF4867)
MQVKKVIDPSFRKYGKVIEGIDFSNIMEKMGETPCPDNVVYVASVPELEGCPEAAFIAESLYGGMPIQIGYCNGNNHMLNAVEYHRDSEINIAVTDAIMIWGSEQDITEEGNYDTSKMEAFLIPAGTAVECYATTLHYAPCNVGDNKFKVVVVLPKGTNTELNKINSKTPEDKLLFARNKWLIGHPDAAIEGAYNGLVGENLSV